jgi:hypothetical protein
MGAPTARTAGRVINAVPAAGHRTGFTGDSRAAGLGTVIFLACTAVTVDTLDGVDTAVRGAGWAGKPTAAESDEVSARMPSNATDRIRASVHIGRLDTGQRPITAPS